MSALAPIADIARGEKGFCERTRAIVPGQVQAGTELQSKRFGFPSDVRGVRRRSNDRSLIRPRVAHHDLALRMPLFEQATGLHRVILPIPMAKKLRRKNVVDHHGCDVRDGP
jgi:hypothetical protein